MNPDMMAEFDTVRRLTTPESIKRSIKYVRWKYLKRNPLRIPKHVAFHRTPQLANQAAYLRALVDSKKLGMPGVARNERKHILEINMLKTLAPGVRCRRHANGGAGNNMNETVNGVAVQHVGQGGPQHPHKKHILEKIRETMGPDSPQSEVATEVGSDVDPADLPSPTSFTYNHFEIDMPDNTATQPTAAALEPVAPPRPLVPLKRGALDARPPELQRTLRPKPDRLRFGPDAVRADLARAGKLPLTPTPQEPATNATNHNSTQLTKEVVADLESIENMSYYSEQKRRDLSAQFQKVWLTMSLSLSETAVLNDQIVQQMAALKQLLREIANKTPPIVTHHIFHTIRSTLPKWDLQRHGMSDVMDKIAPEESFVKRKASSEDDDSGENGRASKRSRTDTHIPHEEAQTSRNISSRDMHSERQSIAAESDADPSSPLQSLSQARHTKSLSFRGPLQPSELDPSPYTDGADDDPIGASQGSSTSYHKSPHPQKTRTLTPPPPARSLAFVTRLDMPTVVHSDPVMIPHPRQNIGLATPLHTLDVGHSDPEFLSQSREDTPPSPIVPRQNGRDLYTTPAERIYKLGNAPSPYDTPSAQANTGLSFTPIRRRSVRGSLSLAGHDGPSPTPARISHVRPPGRLAIREEEEEEFTPSPIDEEDQYEEDRYGDVQYDDKLYDEEEYEEENSEAEVDELEDDEDLAMPSYDDLNSYSAAIYGSDDGGLDDANAEYTHHTQPLHTFFNPRNVQGEDDHDDPYPPPVSGDSIHFDLSNRRSLDAPPAPRLGRPWVWGRYEDRSLGSQASNDLPQPRFGQDTPSGYSDGDHSEGRGGNCTGLREASFY